MRLLFIISSILISSVGFCQTDSIPPIPDHILFMSKKHIATAYKNLSDRLKPLEDKLTVSQYNRLVEGIDAAFNELVLVATEEYKKRPLKK
jgi:hypothetical protein